MSQESNEILQTALKGEDAQEPNYEVVQKREEYPPIGPLGRVKTEYAKEEAFVDYTPAKKANTVVMAGTYKNSDFHSENLINEHLRDQKTHAKSVIPYHELPTTAGKYAAFPIPMNNNFQGMTQFQEESENPNNIFGQSGAKFIASTSQKTFNIDSVS